MTPTVGPQRMLQLAAARLTAPTDYVWRDQEDDRLGYAIAQTLTRDDLGPAEGTVWLDPIEALLETPSEVPIPAGVSNALRTPRSLYVLLGTGVRVRGQDLPRGPEARVIGQGASRRCSASSDLLDVVSQLGPNRPADVWMRSGPVRDPG